MIEFYLRYRIDIDCLPIFADAGSTRRPSGDFVDTGIDADGDDCDVVAVVVVVDVVAVVVGELAMLRGGTLFVDVVVDDVDTAATGVDCASC